MYLYSLYGYEENTVLTNDKKYTKEEFEKMCKEAPIAGVKFGYNYYSSIKIQEYLIKKYNFKNVDYVAGFFFDGDYEPNAEEENRKV